MANRHGRRARQNSRRPSESNASGTPTPDPARTAEIIPWPTDSPTVAAEAAAFDRIQRELFAAPADRPTVEEIERGWWARKNLEAMGFVFPRPGEIFKELGGTHPPVDPRT